VTAIALGEGVSALAIQSSGGILIASGSAIVGVPV
jgi:hypothetical protein